MASIKQGDVFPFNRLNGYSGEIGHPVGTKRRWNPRSSIWFNKRVLVTSNQDNPSNNILKELS